MTAPPLVMHILHRFDTGGLENGVVNLINHMPQGAYRHMVVALTEVTEFRQRLRDPDVRLHRTCTSRLATGPGSTRACTDCCAISGPPSCTPATWRRWKCRPAAWAARVPVRIHGEHGRDVDDLDGTSRRYKRIRRLYSPFVQRYVALSAGSGRLSGATASASPPSASPRSTTASMPSGFLPRQTARCPSTARRSAPPATGWSAPSGACRPSRTRSCWPGPSCG